MKLGSLVFILTIWVCSLKTHTCCANYDVSKTLSDTAIFKPSPKLSSKIYSLGENGILKLDTFDIQINLKEVAEDRYDLAVKSNGKVAFNWKNIAGISRITIQPYFIMFTIFDPFTEDGANEGYAFLYDWHNDTRSISKRKFKNACNPVYYNDAFYLIENLSLIKTDVNFNVLRKIPIVFKDKKNGTDYLDTFLITALGVEREILQISFSPQKSKLPQQIYSGILTESTKKITLSN